MQGSFAHSSIVIEKNCLKYKVSASIVIVWWSILASKRVSVCDKSYWPMNTVYEEANVLDSLRALWILLLLPFFPFLLINLFLLLEPLNEQLTTTSRCMEDGCLGSQGGYTVISRPSRQWNTEEQLLSSAIRTASNVTLKRATTLEALCLYYPCEPLTPWRNPSLLCHWLKCILKAYNSDQDNTIIVGDSCQNTHMELQEDCQPLLKALNVILGEKFTFIAIKKKRPTENQNQPEQEKSPGHVLPWIRSVSLWNSSFRKQSSTSSSSSSESYSGPDQ